MSKEVELAPWWDVVFAIVRHRYDSRYSAARCASLEMFVPIERALGPAYRPPPLGRASCSRAAPSAEDGPNTTRMALETALQATPLPVSVGRAPARTYVVEIPDSVIRVIDVRPELLEISRLESLERWAFRRA